VFGASLFYGDSLITPAISVLSAVEGLEVTDPGLASAALPTGVIILVLLFGVQRWGTHRVARLFGPVMVLWFGTLAVLGVPRILSHPGVLRGLSPTYVLSFVADHPYTAFIAMGAVVLVITGAEALYADLGHFGRRPIRVAWFAVAFPALILNYLGQAALILDDPTAVANPFYLLAPGWARLPLVVLATCATVIASQAVISGAFSMSRQAVRLGFLPRLTVRYTSTQAQAPVRRAVPQRGQPRPVLPPAGRPHGRRRIPHRSVTLSHGRISYTRLNALSATRRNRVKPASVATCRIADSPACAPSAWPPGCDSALGTQRKVDPA
jgi:KUP system potassium uptake protein